MITTIKCCVRIEDGKPIVFTDQPAKTGFVECFTWLDMHNEASREHMRRLPLADDETADNTIGRYQAYVNKLPDCADINLVRVKRIRRRQADH